MNTPWINKFITTTQSKFKTLSNLGHWSLKGPRFPSHRWVSHWKWRNKLYYFKSQEFLSLIFVVVIEEWVLSTKCILLAVCSSKKTIYYSLLNEMVVIIDEKRSHYSWARSRFKHFIIIRLLAKHRTQACNDSTD